ncbi:hypothetical protein QC762_0091480 [Podospora pseudocomata]|uniref:Uncharacterized protein n=1 Tax=Podospora pseudocomata TaxID=2093779 RepID=A0ABR0G6P2_9PEZI|nr:hypothetical protein QC762_0091480 [Podospora pseudocomata]
MGRVEWVTDQVRERKSMVGEGVVVVGEREYLEGSWRVMGDIFDISAGCGYTHRAARAFPWLARDPQG